MIILIRSLSILLLFLFTYNSSYAKTMKIPNYGEGGSSFNKTVTEQTADLDFKTPEEGFVNSSATGNPIYLPKKLNGSAVIIISSCGGIHFKNITDYKRWNALFLLQGYVTAVVNTSAFPRKKNCGRNKPHSPSRGVKDVYDATRAVSKVQGIDKNKIFVIGFSLGAMNGAKSIWSNNVNLALKEGEIIPAGVAGLYGGCRYGSKTTKRYLFPDTERPVLWLMGENDTEAPPSDCKVVDIIKEKNKLSDYHIYKNATHCWDCVDLNGFTKKAGNGKKVTYKYDEKITKDSEARVLAFFDKIISGLK